MMKKKQPKPEPTPMDIMDDILEEAMRPDYVTGELIVRDFEYTTNPKWIVVHHKSGKSIRIYVGGFVK